MKSWVCTAKGFENVTLKNDEPIPVLKGEADDHKLIVKNIAATINPVDFKICGFFEKFPKKLGLDSVGLVTEVGPKVDKNLFIPNKTIVYMMGPLGEEDTAAFSEYTKQDSRYCSIVPENMLTTNKEKFLQEVASLPVAAMTAYQVISTKLKLPITKGNSNKQLFKPFQNFFVTAGAGGVGAFCLQFLKLYKETIEDEELRNSIKIFATCSAANSEYCKSLGATHTIDYKTQNIEEELKKLCGDSKCIDAWIDAVGQDSFKLGLECLRQQGEIVTILGVGEKIEGKYLFAPALSVHGVALGWLFNSNNPFLISEIPKIGDLLLELLYSKKIVTKIAEVIPLEKVKEGLEKQKTGHVSGKIIIQF